MHSQSDVMAATSALSSETSAARIVHGSSGSSWTTRAARMDKGWPDAGPPDIILLECPQPQSWQATVLCQPRQHGEQAGIYAYANEASWVKLVLEGAGSDGAVQLILASQLDGTPKIHCKLVLPSFRGSLSLRLMTTADGASVIGAYRDEPSSGDSWAPVPRGCGWLEPSELLGDQTFGSLEADDPRARELARAPLPPGWRAALVTEQWAPDEPRAEVRFTAVHQAPAEPPLPTHQTRTAAEVVYRYAQMNHSLERADGKAWDGVLCLCSSDLRVAQHAAALHKKLGGWLCFSGGMGTGPHSGANLLGWTEPEAVIFAREATRCGVEESASLLVEPAATNTGENVTLSRALLSSRGLAYERVVIVQKPFMERRSWATLKRVWPEVDAVISSPKLSLQECIDGCGVPADVLIAIMVGDLQRIRLYALPPRSFQIVQPIPRDVWTAYEALVTQGFVMNVLPTDAPLVWEPSWEHGDQG